MAKLPRPAHAPAYILVGNAVFWAHLITDQEDLNQHMDYVHWNPVKHGWVQRVVDWPYLSFHECVAQGLYPAVWGYSGKFNIYANE
jgi:hypothetical protein